MQTTQDEIDIFDAHCHPTDTMSSIDDIAHMRARVLTVMATRSQDQDLVADVAERYFLKDREVLNEGGDGGGDKGDDDDGGGNEGNRKRYVVPAFGWHPWFSHQMYYDLETSSQKGEAGNSSTTDETTSTIDAITHYRTVLVPPPTDDEFLHTLHPPISFSRYLHSTESLLQRFPLALVGEIGLDRNFRLPYGPSPTSGTGVSTKTGSTEIYTPGSREGRPLTPYRVNLDHQKRILKAQLQLAGKHRRAVSVHSVQAHGLVVEVLQELWRGWMRPSKREMKKKRDASTNTTANANAKTLDKQGGDEGPLPYPPRICMHSYSGPVETLHRLTDPRIPSTVYFSFSECINFSKPTSPKILDVIAAVPDGRILVESDFHKAGERMDGLLEEIVDRVCGVKGWEGGEGRRRLRRNWCGFVFGEEEGEGMKRQAV